MGHHCTISEAVRHEGTDTLRISPGTALPLKLDLPEALSLTFAVLVPAGGGGDEAVALWVSDCGEEISGSRVETTGATEPQWRTIGPLRMDAGSHEYSWNTAAAAGGPWPVNVEGFSLGRVAFGGAEVSLKLWCDTAAATPAEKLSPAIAGGPQYFYFTSFEDRGIWYFLRYIPWLDWASLDLTTYVRQSDKYALNGKYSAEFVQVPPFGASTLWSREIDIPATSNGLSISFGGLAVRSDAKIAYKVEIDGKVVADKETTVQVAGAWFRYFIEESIPLGSKKLKFEISLVPLPNVPLDNALYMDDLAVGFGQPPEAPVRTLMFGDLAGNIYGLNNKSGQQIWKKTSSTGATWASVAASADVAYYGTSATPSSVVACSADNGQDVWSTPISHPVTVEPVIVDGVVYVVSDAGYLISLKVSDGTVLQCIRIMQVPAKEPFNAMGLVVADGVAYTSSSFGVHAVDISSETVKWHYATAYTVKYPVAAWDDYVFFGRTDGTFQALAKATGVEAWPGFDAGAPIYTIPQMLGGLVIFGTDGGSIYCLEAMTGKKVWSMQVSGRVRGFKLSNDRLYFSMNAFPTDTFYAYSFEISNEGAWTFTEVWSVPIPGGLQSAPLINDTTVYLTSTDKKTYAIDAKNGSVKWKFASESPCFFTPSLQRAPALADQARKYDERCFLTTHNSYACAANGWIYAQQTYSITHQLNDGVRALMLDAGVTKCEIQHALGPDTTRVCGPIVSAPEKVYFIHEDLGRTSLALLPTGLDALRTFASGLREIRLWMKNNPSEVVTIILESQVASATLMTQALSDGGVDDIIFWADKPNQGPHGSWNVATDGWPTLQWMIAANKRLVILSQHRSGNDGLPNVWAYAVENDYGNDGLAPGCKARRGSQPLNDKSRPLFIMNYFVDWSVSHALWYPFHYASQNDYFGIMSKASECAGFAGRLPNFIAVDYYQRGDNGGPKAANMAVDARWKVQKSDVWEDR
jgi:outer membrane protein assembly factor BamB